MSAQPSKMAGNGVRDAGGRFVPGHPGGPGRPRGVDFRRIVLDATGEPNVETALVEVYDALLAAARGGDVAAARLLLDRMAGPVGNEHKVLVGRSLEEIIAASWGDDGDR